MAEAATDHSLASQTDHIENGSEGVVQVRGHGQGQKSGRGRGRGRGRVRGRGRGRGSGVASAVGRVHNTRCSDENEDAVDVVPVKRSRAAIEMAPDAISSEPAGRGPRDNAEAPSKKKARNSSFVDPFAACDQNVDNTGRTVVSFLSRSLIHS